MFHHSQLPAMPRVATRPVTTSGVSAANVVATIDVPASHQGTFLPERKTRSRSYPPSLVVEPYPDIQREVQRHDQPVNRGELHALNYTGAPVCGNIQYAFCCFRNNGKSVSKITSRVIAAYGILPEALRGAEFKTRGFGLHEGNRCCQVV